MKDSLLNEKQKNFISKQIESNNFAKIISMLNKIKTDHAGTAKTKDKRFVIKEIVKHILANSKNREKDFFNAGSWFCQRTEDVSKEIGISLVWRGYSFNKESTKKYLLKIADDPNWEVREYAAGAFVSILQSDKSLYKYVKSLAAHSSENVRRAVVFSALALRNIEELDKAFALLEPLMFDSSKYVKKNLGPFILGSYFGNKFPSETFAKLNKWAKKNDGNVKWNIIMSFNNSFGNNFPKEALEILKLFANDPDPNVKRTMKSTLNFLSKRHTRLIDDFKKKNKIVI